VDLTLIVSTYHEFSHPREMLEAVYAGLKEGGRLVIVEYRAEDETIPVSFVHRMSEEQIRQELEASGFRWRETIDVLPQQHIVVFQKPVADPIGP
jgi:predicted methyltransferase